MLQSYLFISPSASIKTIFVVGFSLFCHTTCPCPFAPSSSSPSSPYYISTVTPLLQQHEYFANVYTTSDLHFFKKTCFYITKNINFAFEIRQKKKQNPKKKKNIYPKDKELIRKIKTTYKNKTYPKDKTFLKDRTCPKDAYLKI